MHSPVKNHFEHPEGEPAFSPMVEMVLFAVLTAGAIGVIWGGIRAVIWIAHAVFG